MMFMLNRCFRSSRSFILIVVLFCSFSEAAFAARRPGTLGLLSLVSSAIATLIAIVYVFGDTAPTFEMPDHHEINSKLYLMPTISFR